MAVNESAPASARITIVLNGESRDLSAPASIATLLTHFNYPSEGIAVAVNQHVIPRSRHARHALAAGDIVDVVQAVGGG